MPLSDMLSGTDTDFFKDLSEFFVDLFSPSLESNCGFLKLSTASIMDQSLAFKYIWDSCAETDPELDKQTESLELNTEINSTEQVHS